MRRAAALLACLLVAGACHAQQSIPVEFPHGLTYVPAGAFIDGKPVRVLLDTGTGGIVVDRKFAEAAGLPMGRALGQALGGGTGDASMYALPLQSVRFGPIRLHDVPAVAMDLKPLFADAGRPFAALLGYPVFQHHVIAIDYAKHTVRVYPPDNSPACAAPVPIVGFAGGTPIVAARVRFSAGGKFYPTHLIVDSGTAGGVAIVLGGKFLDVPAVQPLLKRKPNGTGSGIGGALVSWTGTLAEVDVGSQRFRDVKLGLTRDVKVFSVTRASGALGAGLWQNGSLIVDYPHRQLCIDVPAVPRRPAPRR